MSKHRKALVIGGGAFGSSIASVLAQNFKEIVVLVRSQKTYQDLLKHKNTKYLGDLQLQDNIVPALTKEEAQKKLNSETDLIVYGLPSYCIKEYLKEHGSFLESFLHQNIPFLSLSKGIDYHSLELPDDLFYSRFHAYRDLFCFLSGPSFAKEILDKQITLVSLAGKSRNNLLRVSEMLNTSYFKVFHTFDVKGVLLGGSLKNVLAIAAGIIEGLGYNHNTRAALITRGITEMLRFGIVYNSRPETFYGLSGMGDLILTTSGSMSRNKLFGLKIAQGQKPQDIIDKMQSAVEGFGTTKAVYKIMNEYKIRASIFRGTYSVLYEDISPQDVVRKLMSMTVRFDIR